MKIAFTVPATPVAKGRPRTAVVGGRARIFTPSQTDRAERDFVALAAPYAPARPITGPVILRLIFVMPIPRSRPTWSREAAASGRVYPRGPKDTDNLGKLVQDALNRSGRWWVDDAQVQRIDWQKVYGAAPETRVELEEIAEPRSAVEWKAQQARRRGGVT